MSHARNTGMAAARALILAFTDDDVRVDPGWLAAIARALCGIPARPQWAAKMLPLWPAPPPPWLPPAQWGPAGARGPWGETGHVQLAVLDGSQPSGRSTRVQPRRWGVNRFAPRTGPRGSNEDHEFFLVRLRSPIPDPSHHLHRLSEPRGNDSDAFTRELRLLFFSGFLSTRRRQSRELAPEARPLPWRDLMRGFMCALVRRPNTARAASGSQEQHVSGRSGRRSCLGSCGCEGRTCR